MKSRCRTGTGIRTLGVATTFQVNTQPRMEKSSPHNDDDFLVTMRRLVSSPVDQRSEAKRYIIDERIENTEFLVTEDDDPEPRHVPEVSHPSTIDIPRKLDDSFVLPTLLSPDQQQKNAVVNDYKKPVKECVNRCSVSFGKLHIFEFPVVLGDNPSVQFGGPPIRLEYDEGIESYMVMDVDEYEQQRGNSRRCLTELRVPPELRRKWVGRNPVLERQTRRTQCQRRRTASAKPEWDEWHYCLEKIQRGMVKTLGLRRRRRPEPPCPAGLWCQRYKQEQMRRQQQQQQVPKQQKKNLLRRRRRRRRRSDKKPEDESLQLQRIVRKKSRVQDISTFYV